MKIVHLTLRNRDSGKVYHHPVGIPENYQLIVTEGKSQEEILRYTQEPEASQHSVGICSECGNRILMSEGGYASNDTGGKLHTWCVKECPPPQPISAEAPERNLHPVLKIAFIASIIVVAVTLGILTPEDDD